MGEGRKREIKKSEWNWEVEGEKAAIEKEKV